MNIRRQQTGRGAQLNPKNKFVATEYATMHPEAIDDWETARVPTRFLEDDARTIVNRVESPDVGMSFSINPYQGCEHGCIYCYARNTHEYWGYSAGVDFESKIIVKKNAAALLRKRFEAKTWQPTPVSLSGNTDCYQPAERRFRLTRSLLEVCRTYRNPVGIITKNALVLRDLDILKDLAAHNLVAVYISVTGTDEALRKVLEPRTATYKKRFRVIETLAKHQIPVGVMHAPVIPGLNDTQLSSVLAAASGAGARWAGYTVVRLNGSVAVLFKDWLMQTFPDRAEKVWNQVAACHGGNVQDSRFGARMKGSGAIAAMIRQQFALFCRKYRLNETKMEWNLHAFQRPSGIQGSLF